MTTSGDIRTGRPAGSHHDNPLARAQRLANWSLICSVLSFFTTGITSFIAFYLASRAMKAKEGLGVTSVDRRVRNARIVAVVALVLWTIFWIAIFIAAAVSESEPSVSEFRSIAESTAVELAEDAAPGFTAEAECAEPNSTAVGTTFDCTITFDDGEEVLVVAEITGENTVFVSG